MSSCCVKFCGNKVSKRSRPKNISFFRFPSDPLMKKIWIENCDLRHLLQNDTADVQLLKKLRVCGVHFEDKMFLNPRIRNRLIFNAVPTLFNGVTLLEEKKEHKIKVEQKFVTESLNASCSSPVTKRKPIAILSHDNVTTYHIKSDDKSEISSNIALNLSNISSEISSEQCMLLNEIEKKNQEIKELKEKLKVTTQQITQINTVEQLLKLSKLYLPQSLFLLVKTHINYRNKKIKEFLYCNEILELAKTIYLLCPHNVYRYLQSILPLPAPFILKRYSNLNEILPLTSNLSD